MATILALTERARAAQARVRREVGPGDTEVWFVRAGSSQFQVRDSRVQLFEFLPKDLTITAGDTIVWAANAGHTVTFVPAPPPPEHILLDPQPDGPPLRIRNPEVLAPSKPGGVFDPREYFNSGPIAFVGPSNAWALTFETPGTFEYFCAFHRRLGMEGSITVVGR